MKSVKNEIGTWVSDEAWHKLDLSNEDQFCLCRESHPAGLDVCEALAEDKAGKKVLRQCKHFEYEDEYDPKYTCICAKCLVRGSVGQCERHILK